jgi:hypothetical protein
MINDNLLAERLNSYRDGDELPEPETEELINQTNYIDTKITLLAKMGVELVNLSFVFLKSISYGFALNTIFFQDWKFVAMLAVGFSLDTIITTISEIFTRNK